MTTKALLYCRVSTDIQAESGFSLQQQVAALREHCRANDIEIVAVPGSQSRVMLNRYPRTEVESGNSVGV